MFNNYKEIVTKTIIGKGKKKFNDEYEINVDTEIDTVLGCWVINHKIKGKKDNDYVKINGNFDINIWYSYDNNSKTNVVSKKVFYEEKVKVKIPDDREIDDTDVIIRSLKNPTCVDVSCEKSTIKYTISKELGIELIGDTKIRIPVSNTFDDYDLIVDDEDINNEIDRNVNVEYIDKKS